MTAARRTFWLIALFTLARLAFGALTGFGVDESYTVGQSRFFALSYFDHPPLHLWLAGAFEGMFGPNWPVRLPFIALFAGSSWLMFRLTCELFDDEAGFWATGLFNSSPFFFASAGTWVVPDGPFVFFLLFATLFAVRLVTRAEPLPLRDWLVIGLMLGLAALSKYLAAFLGLGIVILVLWQRPRELLRPGPYLAAALTLLVLAPVLVWNMQHDFASFRFQSARSAGGSGVHLGPFIAMALGQLVWLGPWIVWPMARGVLQARREASQALTALLPLALPAILFFTVQPLWSGNALPHWTMGGFALLLPFAGLWLARAATARGAFRWGAGVLAVLAVLVVAESRTAFLRRLIPSLPASGDPLLDLYDWRPLASALDNDFVVALSWIEGGKIDLVAGRGRTVTVAGNDPRGFALRQDNAAFAGRSGLLVASRKTLDAARPDLARSFATLGPEREIMIGRAGLPEIPVVIMPFTGYRPALPYSTPKATP